MGTRINWNDCRREKAVNKNRKLIDKKNILNLHPSKPFSTNNDLDVWSEEIKAISNIGDNSELLIELIIEAVIGKLALVGSEKEEIANFLKFYLLCDPTITSSIIVSQKNKLL